MSGIAAFRRAAIILPLLFILSACSDREPDIPGGIALVYGISVYPQSSLRYAADDAAAIASRLADSGYRVTLRRDAEATRSAIEADLVQAASTLARDETLVFYYSGHGGQMPAAGNGEADGTEEWLFPAGSVREDGGGIDPGLGLRDDELGELLAGIPNRQKIVIIDACSSGGFADPGNAVDLVPDDYDGSSWGGIDLGSLFSLSAGSRRTGSGDVPASVALVLAAAGEDEAGYESSRFGHGVFTYFLLDAVTSGDRNGDGTITAIEAYEHAFGGIVDHWNDFFRESGAPGDFWYFLPHVSGGAVDFALFSVR